jgi:hypothetical protein
VEVIEVVVVVVVVVAVATVVLLSRSTSIALGCQYIDGELVFELLSAILCHLGAGAAAEGAPLSVWA